MRCPFFGYGKLYNFWPLAMFLEGAVMAGFVAGVTIETIRKVDWGKDYLWDVRLLGAKVGQFTDWFPATTVKENLATLNNHTFDGFLSTYAVPATGGEATLDISFYDDIEHTITSYLSKWVNQDILNGGAAVTPAHEARRPLQVRKLREDHSIVSDTIYWVIPDGSLDFEGTSDSGSHEYSMSFKIIGVHYHSGH